MGDHGRRRATRRMRRDEARESGFIDSLPKDGDWIAALREEFPGAAAAPAPLDGTPPGLPTGPDPGASAGPTPHDRGPFDHLAGAEPPPPEPVAPDPPGWSAVQGELEDHRALILGLGARLDALEASLDRLAARLPSDVPAPSSVPPPPTPGPPTVRQAVDALRARALDTAARLGRDVARRGGSRGSRRW